MSSPAVSMPGPRRRRFASARRAAARVRGVPAAAWTCALVALLNAAAWSLLSPPFQKPDEPAHYAYVEHLAQTGRPPAEAPPSVRVGLSPEQQIAMRDLRSDQIGPDPANAGIWLALEQRRLQHDLHAGLSRHGDGYSFGATPQPPLYYALAAVAYRVADGGTLVQRMALARLVSALLGGVTVLLTFLFLREVLPRWPWTWTVGALVVALQPMFAWVTSAVTPDALLFTASAALFLCVARAFRHGLSPRLAVAIGVVAAVGMLTKLTFLSLLPGLALALVVTAVRRERSLGRERPGLAVLRLPALALAVAATSVLVVMLLNVALWDRPAIGLVSGNSNLFAQGSLMRHLAYAWESYLPPLPGMMRVFDHDMTFAHFEEFVGRFGIAARFPEWVERAAAGLAAIVTVLALRAVALSRQAVRRRVGELLCYGAMAGGLWLLVTVQYYATEVLFGNTGEVHQVRYFFPLLPLYAAVAALAVRGAGRRMHFVGAAIVMLAVAHNVWAQLILGGRFYG
jgi:4-amino-4-deoxy-L-arabinose transferase-like glycosyltransferase